MVQFPAKLFSKKVEAFASCVLASAGDGIEAAINHARKMACDQMDDAQMDAGEALGRNNHRGRLTGEETDEELATLAAAELANALPERHLEQADVLQYLTDLRDVTAGELAAEEAGTDPDWEPIKPRWTAEEAGQ